jgi:DNA-binding NarL/FixJ family response regulator
VSTAGPARIRTVLVDDHPVFRDGLAGLLRTAPDIEVLAVGGSGEEAVELVARLVPDVLVVDLHMPGLGGVEAIRRILPARPDVRVLVLTMDDADGLVVAAVRAGARGYLLKDSEPDDVLRAVRAIARGEAVFGAALAGRLAGLFTRPAAQPFDRLTAREREVLGLVARGLGNAVIAERLGISLKTVRNIVSAVLVKLPAADRAQAVVLAREAGLGGR